ncbi:HNH endonuclease family protein [Nocardia puris]|uniref:HNH endonuclease family protein n=1 Tax=Nocardia puris TaxID=208602 RepID=UPI001E60BDE8|nr:HNH endonuclease family protein [Nocardia puris]
MSRAIVRCVGVRKKLADGLGPAGERSAVMTRSSTKPGMVRRALAFAAPILVAIAVVAAYTVLEEMSAKDGSGPGPAGSAATSAQEIRDLLGKLTVAAEGSMTGYDREKFPHWDTNKLEHGFGDEFARYSKCSTREVMLLRDSTGSVTLDPKTCVVTVGADGGWRDRYGVLDRKTGQLREYKWITDSSGVDAEHIVPLAEAWRSGAAKGDEQTRRRIANDALNLEASDPTANRSKGDQDAANYLPPGEFRCGYVERYVRVKIKYGLTVDTAEMTALRSAVDECVQRGGFR